jgi:hypothetical protein
MRHFPKRGKVHLAYKPFRCACIRDAFRPRFSGQSREWTAKPASATDFGQRSTDIDNRGSSKSAKSVIRLGRIGRRMACPFLLAGFDPRQVGALPRRSRLPPGKSSQSGEGDCPFGRDKETHAFPRRARDAATKTVSTRTNRGQRPTRRAGSARRGRGGRWPGALGPRRAWDQRSAEAGAMDPAIAAVKGLSSVRAGPGNALRFPARAGRFPVDRQVREKQKASARPGGREAPAGGGAGAGRGLWAPGWRGFSVALWQGRWPLPLERGWWFGL